MRDPRRTARLLGQTDNVGRMELLSAYLKAFSVSEAELDEMRDAMAISTPFTKWESTKSDMDEYKRYLVQYGLIEGDVERNWVDRTLNKTKVTKAINTFLSDLSEKTEMASKVAAWRLLKKRGVEQQEAAFKVRNYAGTPDWRQGGDLVPVTNVIWMFSRVRWTGMAREAELARQSPGRFFWRLFTDAVIPSMVMREVAPRLLSMLLGFGWDDEEKEEPGSSAASGDEGF